MGQMQSHVYPSALQLHVGIVQAAGSTCSGKLLSGREMLPPEHWWGGLAGGAWHSDHVKPAMRL